MKSHGDGTAPTIVRRVREGSVRSRATSPPFAAVVSATTIAIVAFAWTPATTILVDVFVRRDTWLLGVEVVHLALSYLVARFAFGARSPLEAACAWPVAPPPCALRTYSCRGGSGSRSPR